MPSDDHVNRRGLSWTTFGIIVAASVPIIVGLLRIGGVENQIESMQSDVNRLQAQELRSRDADAALGERTAKLEAEVKLMLDGKLR